MLNFMMGRGAPAAGPRMSAQDAVERSAKGEITVVDVRDHNEIAMSGKAEGAIHIPLAVIRMQADPRSPDYHPELDTTKPVAVYCASGARSQMAAQVFQQMGFEEVHNIGGLGHWHQAGGNITR